MKIHKIKSIFLLFTLTFLLMNCTSEGVYSVRKIPAPIQLTGTGADENWDKATTLTDFTYPWREEIAPKTEFKALHDSDHLYFLYRATDPNILAKESRLNKVEAVNSDRIELFFKGFDDQQPYYALELDALGRILDTKAKFGQKIDFDWTWPEGHLIVKATIDATGYWVEGSISFESLRDLDLYADDGILKTGLYRAEYVTEGGKTSPKWISWIHPDSETPQFHIPSSFGILELEE